MISSHRDGLFVENDLSFILLFQINRQQLEVSAKGLYGLQETRIILAAGLLLASRSGQKSSRASKIILRREGVLPLYNT